MPHETAFEKIPMAARRMGVSVSQFYRLAKRDGLRIVKITERSSAVPSADIDAWIADRIRRHAAGERASAEPAADQSDHGRQNGKGMP